MTTKIITCPEFVQNTSIAHGFFTRNGGVSEGIYSSLNVGAGSNDNPDHVQQNRQIAMQAFASDASNLHTLYQIHSDKAVIVDDDFKPGIEADAMVTNMPGKFLGVLTADCTPVLFADSQAGVVAAAHAGWKGAVGGVLKNTIAAMHKLGADNQNIQAVIGPTISQNSYEVGQEFYDRFLDADESNIRFFIPSTNKSHHMFNLPAFVESQLTKIGICNITNVSRDTYTEIGNFFSYRRCCHNNESDYGRNLSVIGIKI